MITVKYDEGQLKVIRERMTQMGKPVQPAIKDAINETAAQFKKELGPRIRQVYTAKRSAFKESGMKVKKATGGMMTATITARGETNSLFKGFVSKRGKRAGVSARVLSSSGMKPLVLKGSGQGTGIKAFVAKMASGHVGIFQRTPNKFMRGKTPKSLRNGKQSRGREGISELFGPSAPKMIESPKVYGVLEPKMGRTLQEKIGLHMMQALTED